MRARIHKIYLSRRAKSLVRKKNRLLTPHQRRWRGLHEAPPVGSSPLIFSDTTLQKPVERVMWNIFTLAIWSGWIYLWLPLLILFHWLPGGYAEYDQRASPVIKFENFKLFLIYSVIILCIGVIMAVRLTIKIKKVRRQQHVQPPRPPPAQLAAFTNMPSEDLVKYAQCHRVLAHHDSHGRLQSIENLAAPEELKGLPAKLDHASRKIKNLNSP